MFIQKSKTVCGYNVKPRIDAEKFPKVTCSHADIFIYDNTLNNERKTVLRCYLNEYTQLSTLTQAGIGVNGLVSLRRYRCWTAMVSTTVKTHMQIRNSKYTTATHTVSTSVLFVLYT